MTAHRVRYDMADEPVERYSSTDGEELKDQEEWGAQYVIESAGAETRQMPAPVKSGLRMDLVAGTVVGAVTIDAPSGQDFDGAGGDQALLAAAGEWICFQSFNISGTPEWRVLAKHADVEVA